MGSAIISSADVAALGQHLIAGVRQIDLACTRKILGVDGGLCNIEAQFRADVAAGIYPAPPKTLKAEDTISWLLSLSLPGTMTPALWKTYPGTRKTCDLVVTLGHGSEVWIELKMAWKACAPGESHSVAQDFDKLSTLAPPSAHLGVLLIGYDSANAPMEADVVQVTAAHASGWTGQHVQWRDRRSEECRINCWFWQHEPKAPQSPAITI